MLFSITAAWTASRVDVRMAAHTRRMRDQCRPASRRVQPDRLRRTGHRPDGPDQAGLGTRTCKRSPAALRYWCMLPPCLHGRGEGSGARVPDWDAPVLHRRPASISDSIPSTSAVGASKIPIEIYGRRVWVSRRAYRPVPECDDPHAHVSRSISHSIPVWPIAGRRSRRRNRRIARWLRWRSR